MPESLMSQTVLGFSTAAEATYGVNAAVLASSYTPIVTRARALPVPQSEKTDDRGVIGRGNSMYPSFQRSGFRVPTAFELTDMVQVGNFLPLLRRFMGKPAAAPTTVEATKAFKHIFYEADPSVEGLQLPSSSCIYSNNEYDYLLPGGVGSTLQLSQAGAADPSYTLSIVTSGQSKRIAVDYPAFGAMSVPVQQPYMYGPSSAVQYTTDTSSTVSLTTPSHKWRGTTFSANNNLITGDTRAGMPQADSAEPRRGWYRDFLHFGDRDVSAEFTMSMDSDYSLKSVEELNTEYTNYTWTMFGDLIPTTASANKYEMKLIIPKFTLRAPGTGEAETKMTKSFTIFPLIHSGHYGVYRIESVNGVSTTIS